MKINSLVFLFIFYSNILRCEILKSDYQIDTINNAGEFLIYDCAKKHYACVDQNSFQNCQEERQKSISLKKSQLSCTPLKKFDDKIACIKGNYKVVDSMTLKRFCFPY